MKSLTIGLNFFGGHDTSVFGIFGEDIYGLSEERVTRIKHDAIFPIDALREMLRHQRIDPETVETLHAGIGTLAFEERVFNEYAYEMTTTLRRMLQGDSPSLYIKSFMERKEALQHSGTLQKLKTFLSSHEGRAYLKMQLLGKKRPLHALVQKHLHRLFPHAQLDITFYEHHLAHAYSAYYASPFMQSLLFTFDGEGDGFFSKLYEVDQGEFREIGSSRNVFVPNMQKYDFADSGYASVGNIYSIFTYLLGYTPNADEGKVEALAAFGDYRHALYDRLVESVRIDEEKLSMELDSDLLHALFDEENLQILFRDYKKEDIAAAVQRATEEIALRYLRAVKRKSGYGRIVLAGGVTANVIMNMRIFETLFEEIFIVPAMGDDGIAQGAAVMKYLEHEPKAQSTFRFPMMPYYGSAYTKKEVQEALERAGLEYLYLGDEAYEMAAEQIVEGKIGALFHGRCEFGPRALGNRSIIADVRNKDIQQKINKEIKNRPLFQPFCPSILSEERERLFEKSYENRHMTIAFHLKEAFKDAIPGAVHVDLTARVQFVSEADNPNYYRVLKRVQSLTGFGVIINTSFNKHGRTMVLTPDDAVTDFRDTNLDFMVIEGYYVKR